MPRFFVSSSDVREENEITTVTVSGEDAGHITRVLRMRPGENVTVCDENGWEYSTTVAETGATVLLTVNGKRMSETEPPYRITVYQALVKGDRFDTVLQKATELGATDFVPLITSRCTVKLEAKEYAKKLERWQRIVYEASKQCGRGRIPTVHSPLGYAEALVDASQATLPLFCYEADGTRPLPELLGDFDRIGSASVVIGPEGGFSEEEANAAREAGMKMAGLGKRILRTETAAPFVLACLSYRFEL